MIPLLECEFCMLHVDFQARSSLEFRKQEILLRLKNKAFPAGLTQNLQTFFAEDWSTSDLVQPFLTMTASLPGQPRWKHQSLDLLSLMIYHLLIPKDHPLVQLWAQFDWQAINRICLPGYKNQRAGQRAWAPAQMIALLLLFVLLPAQSETGLLQQVALTPLARWFCGFGLFSSLPDHSSLHTFRKRLGEQRFEALLTWVILACDRAGLIDNQRLYFDMTGVTASAHPFQPYERAVLLTFALIRLLERTPDHPEDTLSEQVRLLAAEVALEAQDNEKLRQKPALAPRLLASLDRWRNGKAQPLAQMRIEQALDQLLNPADPTPTPDSAPVSSPDLRARLKSVALALKNQLPHARGDLDARLGWTSDVKLICGYWQGFLVDSRNHIITAVRYIPVNQMQSEQMILALDQHRDRLGSYPQSIVADSAQDYDPVHLALEQRQIQGQIASRRHQGAGGGLGSKHYRFNPAGELLCPAGRPMRAGKVRKDGLTPHRGQGCATCELKAACLPKGQQQTGHRLIHLNPEAHRRWLQNRENTFTPEYKQAQQKRFASEGLFGLAGRLHHGKRASYRSEAMNRISGILVGMAMNMIVLSRHPPGPEG